jgi:Ca2+-binding EF-hand superfamily protein
MRSTLPVKMLYTSDLHVPAAPTGTGNRDFHPKLSGHDFRQPGADVIATKKMAEELRQKATMEKTALLEKTIPTITVPAMIGKDDKEREPRQQAQKSVARRDPKQWFSHPQHEQVPLTKDEGDTWNAMESQQIQGEIKGQDRLMRSVRHPRDIHTPLSDAGGGKHPLNYDREEYYPGRDRVDAVSEQPGNDYQVRPVHLPDFYNPPPEGGDTVSRMQRIREVIRQRYAGRPGLVNVFRNCALTKSGYVFPADLMQVLDQMGIKVSDGECRMLVKAVDKDQKGAVTFEEFADLVYGSRVNVGGPSHEPQERHVRHVTKTLVDDLIHNGQALGKAFCEIDPERIYKISKPQFANALGTACNHISKQAVDFLWAAQFPGKEAGHQAKSLDHKDIDWRSFMSQLAHFAHDQRPPTPCCVQGRKRQYDLLQRTAAITGGSLDDVDLNRPDQNADDDVTIVADKLVHRHTDLLHHPREASFLTEPFVEDIRIKSDRTSRALPKRLPEKRLRHLLKTRDTVHQDELVEMICHELERPSAQEPLAQQRPVYESGLDVMTLDPQSFQAQKLAAEAGGQAPRANEKVLEDAPPSFSGAACLQLVRADVEAYIATQRTNRDHEVDVKQFLENVYRPPDERKVIHSVNDGLNRQIRGNRPPRERPPHEQEGRYDNYWQARYMMELIADAIAEVENSNGGKLKPSRMFKKLDTDNDGYLSMSDLRSACDRFKIPNTSADLHALFTALDKHDNGSVNIGEFTRNYEVHQGNIMDNMQKPIKSVYHEGGVENGGPVQEMLDAKEHEIMMRSGTVEGKEFMGSGPLDAASERSSQRGSRRERGKSAPAGSDAGSRASRRSNLSAGSAGSSMIYESQVARMTGKGRVSDVIRARCNAWKPQKAELYTSMAPTRYGMTIYPDTRHVTEANVPLSHSFLGEESRFKTTSNVKSIFSVPDHSDPQAQDAMRRHARSEYRVERIKQRQREFTERCDVANEAARQFDEQKIARKALNQLNYERRCHMSCS